MNTSLSPHGQDDLDSVIDQMDRDRVLLAIAGVRELEARHSPRSRQSKEATDLQDEIRDNISEWAGL